MNVVDPMPFPQFADAVDALVRRGDGYEGTLKYTSEEERASWTLGDGLIVWVSVRLPGGMVGATIQARPGMMPQPAIDLPLQQRNVKQIADYASQALANPYLRL
jgi:hypothetical protein